jgi:microcystin-dependent protein
MAQPYVGEIRLFAGNFNPAGWEFCFGQLLPISENETLFQLIGTTYGGDGESTFALPDLRSRIPLHMGTGNDGINYQLAQTGGTETVTLTTAQIPTHNHTLFATSGAGAQNSPAGSVLANCVNAKMFSAAAPNTGLHASTLQPAGASQPHENLQPFLCINYIISLFGIFPSPT